MSEEFQAHVFDSFSRERTSTQSGIKGTGLGMAITRNIVAMTANAFEEDKEKSFKTGMNAHITKPIDINNYTCCFRSGAWNFIKPSQIKEIKNMDYGHLKKELPKKQE